MKKLFIILLVLISINSYAVTSLGNFSTNNTRRIVSNSVTIVRWTFTTIADLLTIYNKTECAVKTEQLETHDIVPIIIGISGAFNLVPYVSESRMIISIIPNSLEYNLDKVKDSEFETNNNGFWFVGDEVKEILMEK